MGLIGAFLTICAVLFLAFVLLAVGYAIAVDAVKEGVLEALKERENRDEPL